MRTVAQKPKATQQTTSDTSRGSGRRYFEESRGLNSMLRLQRTIGNQAVLRTLRTNGEEAKPASLGTASSGFGRDLSRIPTHSPGPRGIQTKLAINQPGDVYEQEAERVAGQVLTAPHHALNGQPPSIQRFSGQVNAPLRTAPASVDQALARPGRPLEGSLRQDMELRFGHDFSQVRLHSDAPAEQSARDVNAHAYTVGHNIVFGAGQLSPGTHEGRRLIAHELAHVVQQADANGTNFRHRDENRGQLPIHPPVLRRQPAPVPTWKELWPQFKAAQASNAASATALAEQLASAHRDDDDLRLQGLEVVAWLQGHGKTETALILLFDVSALFAYDFKNQQKLPRWVGGEIFATLTSSAPIDPRVLIDAGKTAARAGQHREAIMFFGRANEILSFYILQVTKAKPSEPFRTQRYAEVKSLYDALREIYQFYPQLEEEARAAGNAKRANRMHARGAELRRAVMKEFGATGEAEIAETTYVKTSRGDAYQLTGANDETTELTKLPGLSQPSEMGSGVFVQDLSTVQSALMDQADFQEEIGREPEIRKKYPQGPIDLHDTKTRQTVWSIMFGVFKNRGSEDALALLMELIGRYLKAFTVHTTYNIRDFGTSYLESSFPTDLAGRAARDCGVYALTVAWDVYKAAKDSGSGMDLEFSLAVMLDHVILLINDNSTKATYIISNDKIRRVDTGDVGKEKAREYASNRDLEFLVSPEIPVPLGSTSTSPKDFPDQMWKVYVKSVKHAADVSQAVNKKLEAIRVGGRSGVLDSVFVAQEGLNKLLKDLDVAVDNLRNSDELASRLDALMPSAFAALTLFELIARADQGPDPQHPVQVGLGKRVHPLVRVALAVLRVQELGGSLNVQVPGTKDGKKAQLTAEDYIEHCQAFFQSQMAENRDAAKRGDF